MRLNVDRPDKAPSALSHYRITVRLRSQMTELRKEVEKLRALMSSAVDPTSEEVR